MGYQRVYFFFFAVKRYDLYFCFPAHSKLYINKTKKETTSVPSDNIVALIGYSVGAIP